LAFGDVSQLRPPLQDNWSHSGQAQFTGQHQAGPAGTHNDHVGVHYWPLSSQFFVAFPRDL
jgi:hypothetical protein